ncbi:MAG: DUF115 domain-containing protein [Paramuribaculum sp.]|nr:DUF115 domain-containing protein [Paramuribaculum sp.]
MTHSAASFISNLGASLKSIVKTCLQSRHSTVGSRDSADGDTLVILGNGPSLRQTIDSQLSRLRKFPLLAVNFAANTPEFRQLRPRYYVLVDPAFFTADPADNVTELWHNLQQHTGWKLTLFVPVNCIKLIPAEVRKVVDVRGINAVGIEGFRWLRHTLYKSNLGMPRPRNVLIPSIMVAIALGFKNIYLVGADHSWTRTLDVNERNEVVSIQPHYYADSAKELDRVASVYRNIRLHEIMYSFHVAFKSYFDIKEYAETQGVNILNATPQSFIDAFNRCQLPEA